MAKKSEAAERLTRLRDEARNRVNELQRLLREKELENENASRRVAELNERLETADGKLGQLRKMADTLPEVQSAITGAREREAAALAKAKELETELSNVPLGRART